MADRITIVGGGLSGLALGIGLRRQNIPVTIWEAGNYPRHRVCGEFIHGAGQRSLQRLGLLEQLVDKSRACQANDAAFFSGSRRVTHQLPEPAICVARYQLDEFLAQAFVELGGELRTGERWSGTFAPGIVRAAGRRPEPISEGWRWFGLKVHAQKVRLDAGLELHFDPKGYVGICRLVGDAVNVCGLFRSRTPVPNLATQWKSWLTGGPGSVLQQRLGEALFDEKSFCSVAGVSLRPMSATEREECCIGDSVTMIPPLTGNGMSMAFESAELGIEPLAQYSLGEYFLGIGPPNPSLKISRHGLARVLVGLTGFKGFYFSRQLAR